MRRVAVWSGAARAGRSGGTTWGAIKVEKIKMNGNFHARGLSKDSIYHKDD